MTHGEVKLCDIPPRRTHAPDTDLRRLTIRRNDTNAGIAPIHRAPRAAHAVGRHARVLTGHREARDVAVEVAVVLEEGHDDPLDERLEEIEVVGDGRVELVGREVEDVLDDEAADLLGRLGGEVGLEGDEVVEPLVAAEFAGVQEEHAGGFHEGGGQREGFAAAELVEVSLA